MRVTVNRSAAMRPSVDERRELGRRERPHAAVPGEHRAHQLFVEIRSVTPGQDGHHEVVHPRSVARAFEIEQRRELAVLPEHVVAEEIAVDDAARQVGVARSLGVDRGAAE